MSPKRITDGLADLARSNQQTRDAALMRATTELFVQDQLHDRDALHRYEELATHFLPKISVKDRIYVSELLAGGRDAPQAVIRMLAKDMIEIAGPVIARSPVLDALDLLAVIAATGVEHHRVIARRPELSDKVKRALRLTGDVQVLAALGAQETSAQAEPAPPPVSINARRPAPSQLPPSHRDGANFLGLERSKRLRVLADYAIRPPAQKNDGSPRRLDRAFRSILSAAKIVGYARSRQRDQLIATIGEGLDLDAAFIAHCLDDPTGEGLAVMLKALRLDDAQAQQVFLLATPAGQDTAAFFPLADLYSGMEPSVAETMVDAWRATARGRKAEHQPHLADEIARPRGETQTSRQSSPAARENAQRA